ncbi:MAG: ATP phosphoribosyltransferase regulatory subunit [Anaerolineae bacterium]|nr:ATP phosphoribosyltransferase regulatory subunit [Anaerolineae bacterium]
MSRVFEVSAALDVLFRERGYVYTDLSITQPTSLFLTRAGDKVIDRLVMLAEHHPSLVLRPEFTAPALALYIQQQQTKTARWYFSGPVFTADDGAVLESYSWGAELINAQRGVDDEVEVIQIALDGLQRLGIHDWHLTVGHVGLQSYLLSRFDLDGRTARFLLDRRHLLNSGEAMQAKQSLYAAIQEFIGSDTRVAATSEALEDVVPTSQTMGGRSRHEVAQRLAHKQKRAQEKRQIERAIDYLSHWSSIQGTPDQVFTVIETLCHPEDETTRALQQQWKSVIDALVEHGCSSQSISVQPDLMRHWEYYTGLVFAIAVQGKIVAAGGRYDELAMLLGSAVPVPAVGFAYYPTLLDDTARVS